MSEITGKKWLYESPPAVVDASLRFDWNPRLPCLQVRIQLRDMPEIFLSLEGMDPDRAALLSVAHKIPGTLDSYKNWPREVLSMYEEKHGY